MKLEAIVKKFWVLGLKSLFVLSTSGFEFGSGENFFNLLGRDNPPNDDFSYF